MTDRPILFSGPMVRAIMKSQKTQTRRVLPIDINDQDEPFMDHTGCWHLSDVTGGYIDILPVHFMKGDRLYVRESWSGLHCFSDVPPAKRQSFVANGEPVFRDSIWYWAEGAPGFDDWEKPRPGIHMPRWASRLTLTVTDVRVQRLQSMTPADAIAEGIEPIEIDDRQEYWVPNLTNLYPSPVLAFWELWDSLNGDRKDPKTKQRLPYAWNDNPPVIAVTFKPVLCNIDQMEAAA